MDAPKLPETNETLSVVTAVALEVDAAKEKSNSAKGWKATVSPDASRQFTFSPNAAEFVSRSMAQKASVEQATALRGRVAISAASEVTNAQWKQWVSSLWGDAPRPAAAALETSEPRQPKD